MDPQSLFGVLTLGFSLGLLHAFDADHIMAVSVMTSKTRHIKNRFLVALTTARYCIQWAFGHGGMLLILGLLLVVLDLEIPPAMSIVAEKAIGVFLVAMGGWIIWQLRDNRIKLHVHQHGDIHHVHLANERGARHNHKPVLVGITHGLAGSAPVFALLPAVNSGNSWLVFSYLGLFSAGVLISMFLFGLLFGQLLGWINHFGDRLYNLSRLIIGGISIGFGSYWLLS